MRSVFGRSKKAESIYGGSNEEQSAKVIFWEGIRLEMDRKWSEAAKKFEASLEAYLRLLGPTHESTCSSYDHLGRAYRELGRYSDAEKHLKSAEAGYLKSLGPSHSYTVECSWRVFEMLWEQRKIEDAKKKGKSALSALTKLHGPEHFTTLRVSLWLGGVYVFLSRYDTALSYHQRAFVGFEKTLGPENSETINAQYRLAGVLGEMTRLAEAANIYKDNQAVCKKSRGVEDDQYLRATLQLGQCQRMLRSDLAAEKTLKSMLPDSADPSHEHWNNFTFRAAQELIKLYIDMGRRNDVQNIEKWMKGEVEIRSATKNIQNMLEDEPSQSIENEEMSSSNNKVLRPILNEESFHWELKIIDSTGQHLHAMALIDTQCQSGNWISQRLIERLGKSTAVSQNFDTPELADASGRSVKACGVVELEWKRSPRGNRFHQCEFFIFPPSSNQFDVIFGVEYIVKENLLTVNEDALVPLITHKKISKNDQAAIDIAEEKQRQEKAALQERRDRVQQGNTLQQSENQSPTARQSG